MSDPGPSPGVPRPSSDDPASVPGWVLGVAVVVALALAGALGFAILRAGGNSHHTVAAPPAPPAHHYPAQWDKRIAPYAAIAAKQRGLTFTHPVPVRFLAPAAFAKTLATDQKVTAEDKAQLESAAGLLRAFGLMSGKVDILKALGDFSDNAVLAYYSFDDKRITIRGHRLTPSVRATLVHELTHVLQDQHFRAGARMKRLGKLAKKHQGKNYQAKNYQAKNHQGTSRQSVFQAVLEGDAQRVADSYRDSLPAKQRAAMVAAQQQESVHARRGLGGVPKIITTLMSSPYVLGESLVQTVAQQGGNAAVDDLTRTPPSHDVAMLDPLAATAVTTRTVTVPTPALKPGEKRFDADELGALTWYLMLSAREPAKDALAATDGWAGDAYVAYHRGAATCARVAYAGRTPADTSRMYAALQRWVAASPGTARAGMLAGRVLFESCDPGTGVRVGSDNSEDALTLAAIRTQIALTLLKSGAPGAAASCVASRLITTYTVAQLTDPAFGRDNPAVQAQIVQLAAGCR